MRHFVIHDTVQQQQLIDQSSYSFIREFESETCALNDDAQMHDYPITNLFLFHSVSIIIKSNWSFVLCQSRIQFQFNRFGRKVHSIYSALFWTVCFPLLLQFMYDQVNPLHLIMLPLLVVRLATPYSIRLHITNVQFNCFILTRRWFFSCTQRELMSGNKIRLFEIFFPLESGRQF